MTPTKHKHNFIDYEYIKNFYSAVGDRPQIIKVKGHKCIDCERKFIIKKINLTDKTPIYQSPKFIY